MAQVQSDIPAVAGTSGAIEPLAGGSGSAAMPDLTAQLSGTPGDAGTDGASSLDLGQEIDALLGEMERSSQELVESTKAMPGSAAAPAATGPEASLSVELDAALADAASAIDRAEVIAPTPAASEAPAAERFEDLDAALADIAAEVESAEDLRDPEAVTEQSPAPREAPATVATAHESKQGAAPVEAAPASAPFAEPTPAAPVDLHTSKTHESKAHQTNTASASAGHQTVSSHASKAAGHSTVSRLGNASKTAAAAAGSHSPQPEPRTVTVRTPSVIWTILGFPLSFLAPAQRDLLGLLALVTLFNGAAVWVYLVFFHAPPKPQASHEAAAFVTSEGHGEHGAAPVHGETEHGAAEGEKTGHEPAAAHGEHGTESADQTASKHSSEPVEAPAHEAEKPAPAHGEHEPAPHHE